MKTYEVLEKALALIEDEKDWCPDGPGWKRNQRCAVRALADAHGGPSIVGAPAYGAVKALTRVAVSTFNDTHSHAEVVALFQGAIRAEKAKAGIPLDVPAREKTEGVKERVAA